MHFSESSPEDLSGADDATLARALIDQHPHAARAVFTRFAPLVRRIARRSSRPESDADDAVQDVFANLFMNAHALRDPSAFRSYVVAIAVRTSRLHARRRQARDFVALLESDEVLDFRFAESHAESRQALTKFWGILDRVGSRDRAAFMLRYVEGLQVVDVAQALETSVPTARRRFLRAWRLVSRLAGRDPSLADYVSRSRRNRRS